MHIERRGLHHKALLFTFAGVNDKGEPFVDEDYDEISCNWEETDDKGTDSRGNVVSISARVRVNQNIPIGSILWLGSRDDVSGTAEPPMPETDFLQVINKQAVFDTKGTKVGRLLSLARYHGTLPVS